MIDRPDVDARLARWLTAEATTRPPERLVHATRDRIASVHQVGRVGALGLRFPARTARLTALVTAVVAVALAGLLATGSWFGLGFGPGAGSSPSPTPRPSLTSLSPSPCPSGGGTCLGPLPAGVFQTHSFVPTVGYATPTGWVNTLDSRGQVDLRYAAGGAYTYPDGATFHDAISDGWRVTISLPAGPRTTPDHCTTDHGEPRCASLFISDDSAAQFGFGIVGPETAVIYVLDAPSGDTVMVVADDVDGIDPNGLVAAAQPVVDSLVFP